MFMSRDQNSIRSHGIKNIINYFERVERLKQSGAALSNNKTGYVRVT